MQPEQSHSSLLAYALGNAHLPFPGLEMKGTGGLPMYCFEWKCNG